MDVAFCDKKEAWRGRGHPRRKIPPAVVDMANKTYRTGQVGTVEFGHEDEDDVTELVRLLKSYAKSRGLVMRLQRDEPDGTMPGELRFEMADSGRRQEAA